jgi:hypothetical protein
VAQLAKAVEKSTVFKERLKHTSDELSMFETFKTLSRIVLGKPFHKRGAYTEKARDEIAVFTNGTDKAIPEVADRSSRFGTTSARSGTR